MLLTEKKKDEDDMLKMMVDSAMCVVALNKLVVANFAYFCMASTFITLRCSIFTDCGLCIIL